MSKTVFVIIHTRDMDELDVSVHATLRGVISAAAPLLEEHDTDDEGNSAATTLMSWDGKESLDIWEEEGRVAMTLVAKQVGK